MEKGTFTCTCPYTENIRTVRVPKNAIRLWFSFHEKVDFNSIWMIYTNEVKFEFNSRYKVFATYRKC